MRHSVSTPSYLFILSNLLIMLCGLGILATGIWASISTSHLSGIYISGTGTTSIVLGIVLSCISILGFYATTFAPDRSGQILFRIYMASLVVFLIVQVIFAAVMIGRRGDLSGVLYDAWGDQRNVNVIEKIEKSLSCCGYANPYDRPYPDDCMVDSEFGFIVGCRDNLIGEFSHVFLISGVILLLLAFVEIVSLSMIAYMYVTMNDPEYLGYSLTDNRRSVREGNIPPYHQSST